MFELGYAMKSLGDRNIIMVFNENSGDLKVMPFDLGLKRQITYNCKEEDDNKAATKKMISKKLASALEAILQNSGYINI